MVRCAKLILHGLPLDDPKTPTQQVQPALSASHGDTEWPLLPIAMLEAPYSVPDRFGFVHLQSFVHAKRVEAIPLTGRKSHPLSLMLIVAQQICVERSQHDCVHFDRRCICWNTIFIRKNRLDRSYHKTVLFKITTWHNPTLGLKFASVVSLNVSANNLSPLSQLLPNDKPAPTHFLLHGISAANGFKQLKQPESGWPLKFRKIRFVELLRYDKEPFVKLVRSSTDVKNEGFSSRGIA